MRTASCWCLLIVLFAASFAEAATPGQDRQLAGQPGAAQNASSIVIRRSKRYLDFIPLSRMFFRANIKDNLLRWNNLWGQAYGYRANFVIENRRRMKRSEVYDTISELISQHGFDGQACIMKSICEASRALTPSTGIVMKLFKLIFSPRPYGFAEGFSGRGSSDWNVDCGQQDCPLSLLNVSPFTDE